jgi:hypothetical protein
MEYRVKLIFKYSDVVYVTANSEKEAIEKALPEAKEEYETFYDAIVSEEISDTTDK